MVRDERGLLHAAASLALAILVLRADGVRAQVGPRRFLLPGSGTRWAVDVAVEEAVRDAAAKLASPECRAVFSDFRDSRGRTLAENLAEIGETPATYLGLVLFYQGYGYSWCASRDILATTIPGSRAVYVCGPQFEEKQHRGRGLAAVLIIHEELHSLGLGENPPSSTAITAAVIARCGL